MRCDNFFLNSFENPIYATQYQAWIKTAHPKDFHSSIAYTFWQNSRKKHINLRIIIITVLHYIIWRHRHSKTLFNRLRHCHKSQSQIIITIHNFRHYAVIFIVKILLLLLPHLVVMDWTSLLFSSLGSSFKYHSVGRDFRPPPLPPPPPPPQTQGRKSTHKTQFDSDDEVRFGIY